jgi:hypothetical protein
MGAVVKPGDVLTDRKGERWKVLAVFPGYARIEHLDGKTLTGITAKVRRDELEGWKRA